MKAFLLKHISHMFAASKFSFYGLCNALRTETAFKQEALFLFVLPLAAFALNLPAGTIFLLLAAWLLVLAIELLNMAVESICNLVSPEFNPWVKLAKDAGSAAVLLAITANICLWAYLLSV